MPETNDSSAVPAGNALQLHDARHGPAPCRRTGVRRGIIDAERLAAINADAPKGIVQIARYFGSEFLRPELEKARDRMVNMISLYLLETTGGDLDKAAVSLRDNSLLSRSKGGSDMLKKLIAMPESSNFGMAGYDDAQTALLAVWTLRSHAEYQAELARRSQMAQAITAAQWLAEQFDLDTDELESGGGAFAPGPACRHAPGGSGAVCGSAGRLAQAPGCGCAAAQFAAPHGFLSRAVLSAGRPLGRGR